MQFDLRTTSPDMIIPVYRFPGDDDIGPETYRSVIYGGYVTTTATLYGAARAIGLSVDGETFERWKRIGATAGLLDDFLDESPDPVKSQQLYDAGLASQNDDRFQITLPEWGDDRLLPAVQMLLASVATLPELRHRQLIDAARSIGRIAIAKASTNDLSTYVELLRREAIDSSNLIRYSVSEHMYRQSNFAAFTDWCDHAITLGTLYDHARDLPEDNKEGRTSVNPSLKNQLALGAQAIQPFKRLLSTYAYRHASRAALATRLRYSVLPTERIFSRGTDRYH